MKGNRQVRTTLGAVQWSEHRVVQLEDQLEIHDQWGPNAAEYQSVVEDMTWRQYRLALDELERLVVQHLFELSKLNVSGTGECLSGFCVLISNIV